MQALQEQISKLKTANLASHPEPIMPSSKSKQLADIKNSIRAYSKMRKSNTKGGEQKRKPSKQQRMESLGKENNSEPISIEIKPKSKVEYHLSDFQALSQCVRSPNSVNPPS